MDFPGFVCVCFDEKAKYLITNFMDLFCHKTLKSDER